MDATLTLIDLAGAVALLIWGVHMVQTGVARAIGPQLRRLLGYALGNRFKAFFAGLGVTFILQSSTATGLRVTALADGRARAAAAVFMTEDPRTARQLLGEKEVFRELELRATGEYFRRPRTGRTPNTTAIFGSSRVDARDDRPLACCRSAHRRSSHGQDRAICCARGMGSADLFAGGQSDRRRDYSLHCGPGCL
jgi:Na+/phosphate symporter